MITAILDNRNFRIVFALLVGAPASFLYLILALHIFVLAPSLIHDFNLYIALFLLSAILGLFGIAGAWWRLLKRSDKQSRIEKYLLRKSLVSGIVASLILVFTSVESREIELVILTLIITFGGVLFYVGTPNSL